MEIQNTSTDRISTLPKEIIENILTLLPIGDAVRTSVLSKTWRLCWTSMPKLVFDDDKLEFRDLSRAILLVLFQHTGSILEFSLTVGEECDMDFELDPIILYLSRRVNEVKNLVLQFSENYMLPSWFFSLQRLEILELKNCDFEPPLKFNGFSRLTSVYFENGKINPKTLKGFLSSCPLLTDVYLIGDGYEEDVAGGNKFTFVELLECVPLIRHLDVQYDYMEYLSAGGMPHMLPTPPVHLKNLYLDVYIDVQDDVSAALCLMRNSPYLERIILTMLDKKSDAPQLPMNFPHFQDYSAFNLNHLKDFKMQHFSNRPLECEIIKLVMAKSPMLKRACIEIDEYVSLKDELKILRERIRMPFSRASPSAITSMGRSEPSS